MCLFMVVFPFPFHILISYSEIPLYLEEEQTKHRWSTVQYSTVQYSTVQYSTVQYSTVQYQYSTVQSL